MERFKANRESLERLAAEKGGTITFAGRLLVRLEIDGQGHLYDPDGKFIGIDPAPPVSKRTSLGPNTLDAKAHSPPQYPS